jgi:hypothetical protein
MTPEELEQEKKIATLLSKAVANRESPKSIDYFQDKNKFYRVIRGEAAAKDIQQSGVVRSAKTAGVDYELKSKDGKISLGNRPTKWPSFAKGEASVSYAKADPNHYIIETKSPLSVSATGRHGKGSTHFPPVDPKTQQPHTSLPASEVKLWKHVGEGKYEPVRTSLSRVVTNELNSPKAGKAAGLLGLLASGEEAAKEGKSVYRMFDGGWDYANKKSPEENARIKEDWKKLQEENPEYAKELDKASKARSVPSTRTY